MRKLIPRSLYPVLQRLRFFVYTALYKVFSLRPLRETQLLFLSPSRSKLESNNFFIYDYIQGCENLKIDIVLNNNRSMLKNMRLIWLMSTAKFTIVDDFCPLLYPIKLRKHARLIQVWHALGAFKNFGQARVGLEGAGKSSSITHKNYTDVLVSSNLALEAYASSFGIDKSKIHKTGVPRTDIFFNREYIKKTETDLYQKYPVLEEKKVILFAPTFRGKSRNTGHYPKEFIDFEKLYTLLHDEYVLILKYHPFIKNPPLPPREYSRFFIDLTGKEDINDLLFITDVLVTDYSSVIFEYSFLERPMVLYTPDLEKYTLSRGFYLDFQEYVFSAHCTRPDDLPDKIKTAAVDRDKLGSFKKKFTEFCDGHSTERFAEEILKIESLRKIK